jgi:hypothetical protein
MRLNNCFDFPRGLPGSKGTAPKTVLKLHATPTGQWTMNQTFGCVEYTPLPSEALYGNSNAMLRIMRFHASSRSFQGPPTS